MKILTTIAAVVAMTSTGYIGFANVTSPPDTTQEGDHDYIATELRYYGVEESDIEGLLTKLDQGVTWDALKPDAAPVSREQFDSSGQHFIINRYKDGSISATSIDDGALISKLSPTDKANVSGCRESSSNYATYYKGCKARHTFILYNVGFDFNYQNIRGKGRSVTWAGNQYVRVFGATNISNDKLYKKTSRIYRYQFRQTDPTGTFDHWLEVGVTSDGRTWAEFSY